MLEITVAVSPNVIPERNAGVKNDGEDLDNPSVDTDDNDYTTPPEDEDWFNTQNFPLSLK